MTTASPTIDVADYILVGGGLQNALILLALAARKPAASILLLEREATLGGNHLWSFQARDVPDSAWEWMEPLVEYCWAGYQLNFAASSRWVAGAYRSLSSEHLAQIVAQTVENKPNIQIMTHAAVTRCDPQRVTLADGRIFQGRLIIDARRRSKCVTARWWLSKICGFGMSITPTNHDECAIVNGYALPAI